MKRLPRPARGDEGNLIVALMIILVLTTIGTAMTYRVIGNETVVLGRQSNSQALATANAGLSDALFRLSQGPSAEGSGTQFYVANQSGCASPCVATSVPGIASKASVQYVANQVNAAEWTIDAVGKVGAQTAAVHEIVTRSAEYPFALFANSALTFNGNASGSFSTYDDTRSYSSSTGNPNPNTNGNVAIGSNGSITCNGGISSNVQTDYYSHGGTSSISGGCGNAQSFSTTYFLPAVTTTGLATNCPNNGKLGSYYGSSWQVLTPGTYVCRQPVTINGLLYVTGPVTFYIDLSNNSSYNSSTSALTIATPSYINDMYDYCQSSGAIGSLCTGQQNLPNAENLQMLINSDGQVGFDNGHGYYFGGVLYAPQAYLTQDGCKSQYYGSVTINTLTCNGGPHLFVSYDSALSSLYGNWTVSNYAQVNPSSVSIP